MTRLLRPTACPHCGAVLELARVLEDEDPDGDAAPVS